jgi:hypothetical protein
MSKAPAPAPLPRLTLEEIKKSPKTLEHLRSVFSQPIVMVFLEALQREALPSRKKKGEHVPGAHPDTSLARNDRYWAGWSDLIETMLALPRGEQGPTTGEPEEEPFASTPEVSALDEEIRRAKQQPPQS